MFRSSTQIRTYDHHHHFVGWGKRSATQHRSKLQHFQITYNKDVQSVLGPGDQPDKKQQPSHEQNETQAPPQQPAKAQPSELVHQIQQGLDDLGYKPGMPDGAIWGQTPETPA